MLYPILSNANANERTTIYNLYVEFVCRRIRLFCIHTISLRVCMRVCACDMCIGRNAANAVSRTQHMRIREYIIYVYYRLLEDCWQI